MIKRVTPKGKEIISYYEDRNLRLKFTSGGELPEILSGCFTDERNAQIAIDKYLATKETKEKEEKVA